MSHPNYAQYRQSTSYFTNLTPHHFRFTTHSNRTDITFTFRASQPYLTEIMSQWLHFHITSHHITDITGIWHPYRISHCIISYSFTLSHRHIRAITQSYHPISCHFDISHFIAWISHPFTPHMTLISHHIRIRPRHTSIRHLRLRLHPYHYTSIATHIGFISPHAHITQYHIHTTCTTPISCYMYITHILHHITWTLFHIISHYITPIWHHITCTSPNTSSNHIRQQHSIAQPIS